MYNETHNEKENIQEELTEDQLETPNEEESEQEIKEQDKIETLDADTDNNDLVEESNDETLSTEESLDENKEASNEDVVEDLMDYLSPDILEVREVKEKDLVDTNVEEKFVLHEDLDVNVRKNNIVTGDVVNVSDRDVFIDIGFKTEGIVPLSQFKNPPAIGKKLEVVVERFEDTKGNLLLSKEKADFIKRWNSIKIAFDEDESVTGTIIRRIKGGMVVDLDVIQAFLPGSQIDIKPVTDFDKYLGEKYEFKIVKINELRKNVVLSRKELLATDIKQKKKKVIEEMEVGMVLEGIVKNITDFGAFIDLGGIDGLLHITDITWGRINHPSEKLEIGETLEIKVIDFDLEKVRVSLGLKQLTEEPWRDIGIKYPVDSEVIGKVVNMMNYGLFIELEEGIEGLIHISEISWTKHIKHPSDLYAIGDKINAKVLSLEEKDRKISLGIKQLSSNPWDDIGTNYKVGDIHKGVVKNLTQFGAFINLDDNIDGLLHVSDMSWTKLIRHPKEFLSTGDKIDVKILEVSSEERKVSLGVKQLQDNPWNDLSNIYSSGTNIQGKAIKILSNSIIFELDHNIDGILKSNNKNAFKIGEEYNLTVQSLDEESKKVIIMNDKENIDSDEVIADELLSTDVPEDISNEDVDETISTKNSLEQASSDEDNNSNRENDKTENTDSTEEPSEDLS